MPVETAEQTTRPGPPTPTPTAGRRIARACTEIFAPWVLVMTLLMAVGMHSGRTRFAGLGWGALAALFASIIPFLFIIGGVIIGKLTDHHVGLRSQRFVPLTVCLTSLAVGLGLLAAAGAPHELVALVVAMGTGLVTAIAITFRWKISVHALVAAGAVVILTAIFGPALLCGSVVAAAVCWSRIRLGDHTVGQVSAGALVGALAGILFAAIR